MFLCCACFLFFVFVFCFFCNVPAPRLVRWGAHNRTVANPLRILYYILYYIIICYSILHYVLHTLHNMSITHGFASGPLWDPGPGTKHRTQGNTEGIATTEWHKSCSILCHAVVSRKMDSNNRMTQIILDFVSFGCSQEKWKATTEWHKSYDILCHSVASGEHD